jgi:hypothetical protein
LKEENMMEAWAEIRKQGGVPPPKPREIFKSVITIAAALAVIGLLINAIPLLVTYLQTTVKQEWLRLIYLTALTASGAGLFLFRKKYRMQYGITEVCSALVLGWKALGFVSDGNLGDLAALIGVAYLIVRGFDNIDEGRKQRRGVIKPAA